MDTTVPKVPPQAAAASEAANTVFHQYDFSIAIYSKKRLNFQIFTLHYALQLQRSCARPAPRLVSRLTGETCFWRNFAPQIRGAPGSLAP